MRQGSRATKLFLLCALGFGVVLSFLQASSASGASPGLHSQVTTLTPNFSFTTSAQANCASRLLSATLSAPNSDLPTPTGTVTFSVVGAGSNNTQTLVRGLASAVFNGLQNGVRTATATYNGDGTYVSVGRSTTFTVSCPIPTTTSTSTTTTTTTRPPTTTTTTTTTRPPTTTTSTSSTTTTSTSTTSTTSTTLPIGVDTTTTSTTLFIPPVSTPPTLPPTLVALSPAGQPFGPPGVGLNISGVDYPKTCTTVYVFFEKIRLGSNDTGGSGRMSLHDLSVPGDATVGGHTVSSSCKSSGEPVERAVPFRVTSASVHRSSFLTSLNQPRQVVFTAESAAFSAGITALLFVLLGFPSQVFNSTLQSNYEEVRGWFHLRRPMSEMVQSANQKVLLPLFLAAGGVLYALLTPEFGFNMSSLALSLGLAVAVAVTTIGFALPAVFYFGTKFRDRGQVLVLPGTVLVGASLVLISRLLHFQPGYLYGLLAVVVFHHELDKRSTGKLAAVSALLVMVIAFVAWVARVPLTGASLSPGVGFWTVVAESALAGAFVIGLESTVVGLLPMRFLDGSRIKEWSRVAWGALFAFAVFVVIEVLVQPGSGYVGHTSTLGKIAVAILYAAFAVGTFAFWAYFRYRSARDPDQPNEGDLEVEGEFEVR